MNSTSIKRLLAPRTLALFGGAWADAVEVASRRIGYHGEIWRVHPKRPSTSEAQYFRSAEELPGVPDASFVAAPAHEVPEIAAALARRRAGGFVCFAAGFSETSTDQGHRLTKELTRAAGDLPFFGPNCYGFLNFFDRVALWPDQVVGGHAGRGVAILCQSGTIALNLLFNDRSLPIGYLLTVGNQTSLALEDLIELLCDDERVTAFGLYVEGVKDTARFARAVRKARDAGKPIAIVKAGRTEAAARTAHTHTGSLAGADAVFDSFCRQAGLARCDSLATLCETLKLFHLGGPLSGRRVAVLGASGGDMAMTADAARDLHIEFPPFSPDSTGQLREILSDKVTVANPFDFHTHIWFDRSAMRALFSLVHRSGFDVTAFMVDCPPADQADPAAYLAAIQEYIAAFPGPPARGAVMCSLPESMAASTREACLAGGIIPLQGQREALEALSLAADVGAAWAQGTSVELRTPVAHPSAQARTLTEAQSKAALSAFGVPIPKARSVISRDGQFSPDDLTTATRAIGFPIVIKAIGEHLEHKSDVGGVLVGIRTPEAMQSAVERLSELSDRILIEEMIADGVAEILVGMTVDPQFGQVLVLGAGGVLTELLRDTVTLLPPFTAQSIRQALGGLKVGRLLGGYRGKPPGDVEALIEAVLACTRYAQAHIDSLVELDINPIIVRPAGLGAVAVDALIRTREATHRGAKEELT